MSPQICLGSAQFGMQYGITNERGRIPEDDVQVLLERAFIAGVSWLDTAQSYGNAEAVIGRALPDHHGFRLVTKLTSQSQACFSIEDQSIWEHSFRCSLLRLRVNHVDALLLHSSDDLRKPGAEYLEHWLFGLRERGLVRRLGVSIYESKDLEDVNANLLDLVQLPLSLYDQRLLADGTISRLRSHGCAVHARSLYLQGLLLNSVNQWPAWIDLTTRAHHASLEKLACARSATFLDCALGFARAQEDLEAVVLGLCTLQELEQLLQAWERRSPWHEGEWRGWALQDSSILDPRFWPR